MDITSLVVAVDLVLPQILELLVMVEQVVEVAVLLKLVLADLVELVD
jgi:hypothetical protein